MHVFATKAWPYPLHLGAYHLKYIKAMHTQDYVYSYWSKDHLTRAESVLEYPYMVWLVCATGFEEIIVSVYK